jgi:hypothetical protein
VIAFRLTASRSAAVRTGAYVRVGWGVVDGYLTLRAGEVGPRGGRSKLKADGYLVQEVIPDPAGPAATGRLFWLAKDSDRDPAVYEVFVAPRGTHGYCTCDGYRHHLSCKHLESVYYLHYVAGAFDDDAEVATPELAQLPG